MTGNDDFTAVAQAAAHAFGLVPAPRGEDWSPGEDRSADEDRSPGEDRSVGREPGARGKDVAQRLRTDPETVERDLIKLVLTIVELLRQLMERTALHRVDQGDLDENQEERIGMTLMILEDRMTELCERYGLTMDDLNLDLGPLGSLLPHGQGT